ncbi:unnamed protein product [Mucor hiemalis]
MGVVQSKKKETQTNSTSSKKYLDDSRKKTSIYSADGVPRSSTPISSSNTTSNTPNNKYNVAPSKMSTGSNADIDYYGEPSLQTIHHSNSFYLPKDWDMQEYQYNLHFALKTLHGGNVTPAVAPKLKNGARVVQMGSCSGPWIMDMATQYPDCFFTAVEVIPDSLQALPTLPNIAFDREPYHKGLNFPDGSVDFVHLRSMGFCIGLDKWAFLMKEVYRILKPDGLVRIEEIDHNPKGTVMIESFIETLRQIMAEHNQDYDMAVKYGKILPEYGFQVVETRKRRVNHASDGKVSEDLLVTLLNGFDHLSPILGPRLGLAPEDYRHRIEMICAECVRVNANMDWYSYVAKKAYIQA